MTASNEKPISHTERLYTTVQGSDDFRGLRRSFRAFVFPWTVAFMAWYLLYVVMSIWARDFMGQQIVGNLNVGYVFGLLQFISTFFIATLYSRHANRKFDAMAEQIADEFDLDIEAKR